MKRFLFLTLLAALLSPLGGLRADLTGQGRIRNNIDRKLKGVDISALSEAQKKAFLAGRFLLNIRMLAPIYGSYKLDTHLYGSVRPPAYIVDWGLGGILPFLLLVAGSLSDSGAQRRGLFRGAAALYTLTRIGIFVAINEHISTYNEYMHEKLYNTNSGQLTLGYRLVF